MRKRNDQLNIRLTKAEAEALTRNAKSCGLSKSAYVRLLVSSEAKAAERAGSNGAVKTQ